MFGLIAVLGLTVASGPSTAADVPSTPQETAIEPIAIEQYSQHYRVGKGEAERRLTIQQRAVGLDGDLRSRLANEYAGTWFDNETGRVAAGAISSVERTKIDDAIRETRLTAEVDVEAVKYTLEQLEAGQDAITPSVRPLIAQGLAATFIDTSINHVVVAVSPKLSSDDLAAVQRLAADAPVATSVVERPAKWFDVEPTSGCAFPGTPYPHSANCNNIRGGQSLLPGTCTIGLHVQSQSDYKPYVLTAGHCVSSAPTSTYSAKSANGVSHSIGTPHNYVYPGSGDYAIISVPPGSWWYTTWFPFAVDLIIRPAPGIAPNDNYRLHYTAWSSMGLYVCHTGIATGTSCGTVESLAYSAPYGVSPLVRARDMCTAFGDSGGPVWIGLVGFGIYSGGTSGYCLGGAGLYSEMGRAQAALNVHPFPN